MTAKIVIVGAGSVGAYVGGSLQLAGAEVLMLGRSRMRERILRFGLCLSDLQGWRASLGAAQVNYTEDPALMADAALIIVAVKSADTAVAAASILAHAYPAAVILSLQNGVGNAELLRATLPGRTVLAGMVPFNVLQTPDGRLHRGTEGELMVEASPAIQRFLPCFAKARLPLIERTDFVAVLWGKLLMNLNNGVNALSDVPLKTELAQRAYRRCLALLIEEAFSIVTAAGIRPVKMAKIGPRWLPWVLRLPDWLFQRLAAATLRIDPEARSSTWEDLQAGRRTEVDYLNGAVLHLAESLGRDAPANRRMVALIRNAEAGHQPALSGEALLAELTSTLSSSLSSSVTSSSTPS